MSSEEVQVELAKMWSRIEALETQVKALNAVLFAHTIPFPASIPAVEEELKRRKTVVPEFDPKILMEHQWKGKNIGVRKWAPGSLSWGWEFTNQFPDEVIDVLEKGPLTIEGYVFTLNGKIVNVKKEGVK